MILVLSQRNKPKILVKNTRPIPQCINLDSTNSDMIGHLYSSAQCVNEHRRTQSEFLILNICSKPTKANNWYRILRHLFQLIRGEQCTSELTSTDCIICHYVRYTICEHNICLAVSSLTILKRMLFEKNIKRFNSTIEARTVMRLSQKEYTVVRSHPNAPRFLCNVSPPSLALHLVAADSKVFPGNVSNLRARPGFANDH